VVASALEFPPVRSRPLSLTLLAGALIAVGLSGCGKPAFTQGIRLRDNLDVPDIRRIQFYTSGEIVLRREVPVQQRASAGNELVISNGVVVEEIVIPLRTPGVAVRVEGDHILVSFSREHPERALWFSAKKPGEEVIPLEDKTYQLVALDNGLSDAEPQFVPRYSKGFVLRYDGNQYQLADGRMWHVHLLYDEGGFASKRVRREPPGWKLSDGVQAPLPEAPASSPAPPATP
jgi:hypothetical protein